MKKKSSFECVEKGPFHCRRYLGDVEAFTLEEAISLATKKYPGLFDRLFVYSR
jgi:hypothetical protein